MTDIELKNALGSTLRAIRQARRLTQEDIAHECGLQPHYISMIEGGKRMPSIWKVFQLAKALELKPSDLIANVEDVLDGKPLQLNVMPSTTSNKPTPTH